MNLKNNWKFLLSIIVLIGLNACESKEDKKEAVREAIKNDTSSLVPWTKDKSLALEKVKEKPSMYIMLSSSLAQDKEIIMTFLNAGGSLRSLAKKYKKDKNIVLASLKIKPRDFSYVHESLKKDKDVLLASLHYQYDSVVKNLKDIPI